MSGSSHLRAILGTHSQIEFLPGFQQSFPLSDSEDLDGKNLWSQRTVQGKYLALYCEQALTNAKALRELSQNSQDDFVLVIVRHPLKRLMSGYFHILRMGFFPCLDPKIGIPLLMRSDKYPRAKEVILEGSFPAKFIRQWQQQFTGRVLVIALEAGLGRDQELKKVEKHLNIEPFSENLPSNPGSGGIYNLKRISWLKLQNRFMYDYQPEFDRLKNRCMKDWEKWLCKVIRRVDQRILSIWFRNQDFTEQFLLSPLRDKLKQELEDLAQILNGLPMQWEKDNRLVMGTKE